MINRSSPEKQNNLLQEPKEIRSSLCSIKNYLRFCEKKAIFRDGHQSLKNAEQWMSLLLASLLHSHSLFPSLSLALSFSFPFSRLFHKTAKPGQSYFTERKWPFQTGIKKLRAAAKTRENRCKQRKNTGNGKQISFRHTQVHIVCTNILFPLIEV